MLEKIKKWLSNIKDFDDELSQLNSDPEDITVDEARSNNDKYQKDLERRRQEYKKELCKEIKAASRRGARCVQSENFHADFMSYDFLVGELKQYFEDKGFDVKVVDSRYGLMTSWLEISW